MSSIYANQLHWVNECKYISNVTHNNGKCEKMNNDKQVFLRYCIMQQQQAEKHGFFDTAEYIQQCIDELFERGDSEFPDAPEQKCYVL